MEISILKNNSKENLVNIEIFSNIIKKEILEFIMNTETKNLFNNKKFFTNIIQNFGSKTFLNYLEKNLIGKDVIYLRHGIAEHNYYNRNKHLFDKKPEFFDPDLIEEGIKKLKILKNNMILNKIKFDLVFVSPLKRTLRTLIILKEKIEEVNMNFIEENQKYLNTIIDSNDVQNETFNSRVVLLIF